MVALLKSVMRGRLQRLLYNDVMHIFFFPLNRPASTTIHQVGGLVPAGTAKPLKEAAMRLSGARLPPLQGGGKPPPPSLAKDATTTSLQKKRLGLMPMKHGMNHKLRTGS